MLQLDQNKYENRRREPVSLAVRTILTTIAVVIGTANCGQHGESTDGWEVVGVNASYPTQEIAALAAGTVVAVDNDALVLTLGDAQVRVAGKVTHSDDGGVSITLPDGRKVRWERMDEHHARLVWPTGQRGTTVFQLKRVNP